MKTKNSELKNNLWQKSIMLDYELGELNEVEGEIEYLQNKLKELQEKHKNKLKLIAYIETVEKNISKTVYAKESDIKEYELAMKATENDMPEIEKTYGFKNWKRI